MLPTAVGDLYGGRNDATNIVLQPTPGRRLAGDDEGDPARSTANYQQAGLIVYGDDDNYAKLDLLFAGEPAGRVHPGDRRHAAQRARPTAPPRPPATPSTCG